MKVFTSDNCSGVHPKIMDAIVACNVDHAIPYGGDPYTAKVEKEFKRILSDDINCYLMPNGTGTNVIGLSAGLNSFQGVICCHTAHINEDECGAFERFTGSKLQLVPDIDGKISPDLIHYYIPDLGNEHRSQPRIISISQVSEMGTVYSNEEIRVLADFAHKNNCLLHVDGARIANAIVAQNTTLKEMILDTGVDILSFGGTKNGMMYGEALIILNPSINNQVKYIRKQGMQLMSKMRYIAAQFLAYLEDDLWLKLAGNANKMTSLLYNQIRTCKDIHFVAPVDANLIFATIPEEMIAPLNEVFHFYTINEEENLIRWVSSFDTREEEIRLFADIINELTNKRG